MKCPCKDCAKSGCGAYHDRCESYQLFAAYRREIHMKRCMEVEADISKTDGVWRMKTRKKKKSS